MTYHSYIQFLIHSLVHAFVILMHILIILHILLLPSFFIIILYMLCMVVITLAAKRRWKGMVITLRVCVRKILGKLQTLVARTSYWQTSNYKRIKSNKRLLLFMKEGFFDHACLYNIYILQQLSLVIFN